MKKYLLISMPVGKTKNIGDYVQILAARQFYDKVDGYIEKEELSNFKSDDGNKVKVIMNGWFLWKTENWPPSNDIEPLFVSIHFSPLVIKDILSKKIYLESHSPIGCRDLGTLESLKKEGVDSYYSSCLTLTLGKTYSYDGHRKGVYFVDPFFYIPSKADISIKKIAILLSCFAKRMPLIVSLARREFFKCYGSSWGYESYVGGIKGFIKSLFKATCFYMAYKTKFTDEIIKSANYVLHIVPIDPEKPYTNEDWLNMADAYMKKYMKAELVVTSRIHAALPCLAMETPVIFMNSERLNSKSTSFNTPGRFDGIVDLFRTMIVKETEILTYDKDLGSLGKIGIKTIFKNKDDWKKYANDLSVKCSKFMKDLK